MAYLNENEERDVVIEEPTESTENAVVEEEVVVDDAKKSKTVQSTKTKKGKGTNKIKGTVSELKKVTWLPFGKVMKNTAIVLSVTAVFLLVIMGIDQLLYLLYNLLTKNM
ncbi:MAG: preprotein translocase subunit SecE [Clostridiales bacterium]|nr:preprotein translocase subunit SecE [Clostridiales bacterium]